MFHQSDWYTEKLHNMANMTCAVGKQWKIEHKNVTECNRNG